MATLPVFISLSEAARKYGLEEAYLRQMVERGKIRAAMVAGEMVVSEEQVKERAERENDTGKKKEDLPEYQVYAHLKGTGIGIAEASQRYQINPITLFGWYKRGLISEVKRITGLGGEKILLDEADVAYCVKVYQKFGGRQGKRVFDKSGLPLQGSKKRVGTITTLK
ncbi:MAG: hypothetical protein KatS3mg046_514 [Bellilinea sp.]|nr:MAG: hypothetical protein KatS3mg046_514 [Bellilinea sp.]